MSGDERTWTEPTPAGAVRAVAEVITEKIHWIHDPIRAEDLARIVLRTALKSGEVMSVAAHEAEMERRSRVDHETAEAHHREYEAALAAARQVDDRAQLEAELAALRDEMADMVPATWAGLMQILDAWYPEVVFVGGPGSDPGVQIVALARSLARLREAAQTVVDQCHANSGAALSAAAIAALSAALASGESDRSEG